jgi:hypothetical protein
MKWGNIFFFIFRKREGRTYTTNPYSTLMLSVPKQSVFCSIYYVHAAQCYVSVSNVVRIVHCCPNIAVRSVTEDVSILSVVIR